MAKRDTSNPGDHLLDCIRAPREALRRAAKRTIPLWETASVGVLGLLGLGWSTSGLLLSDITAFERAVLGGLQGLAVSGLVLLFVGVANALQPQGDASAVTLKQSAAIVATSMIGPGVVALVCGAATLAAPLFTADPTVVTATALIAVVTWVLGVVGLTGVGHALGRSASVAVGILSSLGAALVIGFVTWLAVVILRDPPWGTEQPWGFL